eukprot:jgi/Chlat1/2758/Chrsp187S02903
MYAASCGVSVKEHLPDVAKTVMTAVISDQDMDKVSWELNGFVNPQPWHRFLQPLRRPNIRIESCGLDSVEVFHSSDGVDKADVRLVVFYSIPLDLVRWTEGIGRAGRDGTLPLPPPPAAAAAASAFSGRGRTRALCGAGGVRQLARQVVRQLEEAPDGSQPASNPLAAEETRNQGDGVAADIRHAAFDVAAAAVGDAAYVVCSTIALVAGFLRSDWAGGGLTAARCLMQVAKGLTGS